MKFVFLFLIVAAFTVCTSHAVDTYLTAYSTSNFFADNYVGFYTSSRDDSWYISPSYAGYAVVLNFTRFNTETTYDYVRIYQGSTSYYEFSGFEPNDLQTLMIVIPGATTRIRFVTDSSIVRQGFNVTYYMTYPTSSSPYTVTKPSNLRTFQAHSYETVFSYPLSGMYYRNYEDFTIRIYQDSTSANAAVKLDFSSFNTEQSYDFVTITDAWGNLCARISGNNPTTTQENYFIVPGPYTIIHFTSDGSNVGTGFTFDYSTTDGKQSSPYTESKKEPIPFPVAAVVVPVVGVIVVAVVVVCIKRRKNMMKRMKDQEKREKKNEKENRERAAMQFNQAPIQPPIMPGFPSNPQGGFQPGMMPVQPPPMVMPMMPMQQPGIVPPFVPGQIRPNQYPSPVMMPYGQPGMQPNGPF